MILVTMEPDSIMVHVSREYRQRKYKLPKNVTHFWIDPNECWCDSIRQHFGDHAVWGFVPGKYAAGDQVNAEYLGEDDFVIVG